MTQRTPSQAFIQNIKKVIGVREENGHLFLDCHFRDNVLHAIDEIRLGMISGDISKDDHPEARKLMEFLDANLMLCTPKKNRQADPTLNPRPSETEKRM